MIELHARSAFSFLRGANLPEDLVARAAELGMPAIAIADHRGFAGSARAQAAARKHGIRALVGTTLELPDGIPSVVCLAATRSGYARLCRHLTTTLTGQPPAASPFPPGTGGEDGGIEVLTGDRDARLARLLLEGRTREAEDFVRELVDCFGRDHVHVQLTRHHLRDDRRLERLLVDLAEHLKLPLVASNSPLHATRADRLLADAFTCLRHKTTLDRAGALLAPNGERHLKSPRRMRELFADRPGAIAHSTRLAERLDFTLADLGYRFPDAHDEQGRPLSLDQQNALLRRLALEGANERYGSVPTEVGSQLDHELALIAKLGFPGYFLIVHEIVCFARSRGIFCQGRGSAANSAVCYVLGITAVDPVRQGLLFERFLSENRRSWPDIDIDFPSGERREQVIQHVFAKYGPRGAAMTANVITYRPRSAFREMSKVLGFPPEVADRFSELSSASGSRDESHGNSEQAAPQEGARTSRPCPNPGSTPPEAATPHPPPNPTPASELRTLAHTIEKAGIPPDHPRFGALIQLYHAVLGMPRHLGQHSGGMVICDRGLDSIVPLQPASMPGRTILQWDKDDCEDLGIVKVDLLGLGMLAAIEDALHVCATRGRPVDPAAIPKDDPAVFDLLCRADTIGTFQVESRAQMATLPIMKPRSFYDLAIEVAIIRPGPIVGDLVHPYLNRRNGHEKPDFIHPDLEPILGRTLGVPLFQEQVLRMAMTLAGFDGTEADELRRAMAFKRADEKMMAVAEKLQRRMARRGIKPEVREKVVRSIGSFALYGFPESHAISFALIAYLSCWLKVHRPAEFYCGLINNQPMGFYSVNTLLEDAKRHHVRARPVSVVHSNYETAVLDDRHLRLGLHRLKGLSKRCAGRLLAERARRAFGDLPDFLHRVRPTKKERRLLASSGALNPLPGVAHRRDAQWQSELPLHDDLFQGRTESPEVSQARDPVDPDPGPSPLAPMSDAERLATDLSLTGASTGPHPMALWRQSFLNTENWKPANSPYRASELLNLDHGVPITVGGMVICRQRPGTAKGHCFISLEDETGIANLFVPRNTFQRYKLLITTEPFLLAEGRLQISEGDQPTLYTTHLQRLPGISAGHSSGSHDFH